MSGMKKWMVGSLTAMVVTAGSLASLAGPAQAYDKGTCDQEHGAANVIGVDRFSVDTGTVGKVDFGDNPHWFAKPQGTAVVCWLSGGDVAVIGRLFADSGETVDVQANISYFANGVSLAGSVTNFSGKNGASALVNDIVRGGSNRNYDRVRIRLFSGGTLRHTSSQFR